MQQLIITILAMLSVIAPIAVGKLRRMVITPRLLKLFQHMFLTIPRIQVTELEASGNRVDPDRFAGNPDWRKLLGYASSGRLFCIALTCRLFPKQAAAF